ncbi:MAG: hypothetical protein C0510_13000 [Erythrobacter sp.]|nr:hypothetical protein [Erythrobacter sp.]
MLMAWASQQRGASNPFNPSDLGAKLLAWWDVEDAASLTLSGSQISGWRDKVTSTNLAQAIGGSRPIYQATGFNGRPAAFFDGIDDMLEIASVFLPTVAAHAEVYALVDVPLGSADATARNTFAWGNTSAGSAGARQLRRSVVSGVSRCAALIGTGTATTTVTLSTAAFEGRKLGELITSPTTSTVTVGGSTTSAAIVPNTQTSRTRIGASVTTSPNTFWLGTMNSIIVTSALTTTERANLRTFLEGRL